MKQQIEQRLKEKKIPFVSVAECCKAMAAWPHLRHFHYVIYQPAGPNWLLLVGERTQSNRQMMRDWEKDFGDRFKTDLAVSRNSVLRVIQDGVSELSL